MVPLYYWSHCKPHICESVIVECAQLVRETVLEASPKEVPLLDHPTVRRDLTTLIHNVIVAFAQVFIFSLSGQGQPKLLNKKAHSDANPHALEKLTLRDPDEDTGECGVSEDAPGVEAQLLITLSNCAFMRRVILHRLQDTLVRASYPLEEVSNSDILVAGLCACSNFMASFQEAIESLPKLSASEERLKNEILESFRSKMGYLLACFRDLEPISDGTLTHSLA
ncbi:hypothetical protein E2C01_047478 [Portunus trituberculatus]|uniref:Exocyst complex component 2 n=1 Tax=Portunus trituberculatus TaxID=210409 RepID=A0A5B7G3P9_PORTR|nr:hypothetical protein [Portunus trituberculatus]